MIFNRQYNILIIAVIVSFLFGCKPDKYENETKILKSYLNDNFSRDIETNKHYYLLSNSYVCKGCISNFLTIIDSLLDSSNKNITFITTVNYDITEKLSGKINLLKDNNGQLNYENLDLNNLTLIYTEKRRIINKSNFLVDSENEFKMEFKKILENASH